MELLLRDWWSLRSSGVVGEQRFDGPTGMGEYGLDILCRFRGGRGIQLSEWIFTGTLLKPPPQNVR